MPFMESGKLMGRESEMSDSFVGFDWKSNLSFHRKGETELNSDWKKKKRWKVKVKERNQK